MAINYNPGIVTSGLVFSLDALNKRSYPGSGTTVSDVTSNQPNTIMTNGVTYSSDGYWGFDGTDDYIGQANLSTTLSGGTMELWTYITSINREQGFFVLNQGSSSSYINFWMPSTNNMRWEVIGTTVNAYSTINATTIATTNTWYQFVGTFNGTNTKIYVNGVEEATQNMSNQPSGAYTPAIQVGRYDATYPAAARISIVRFYNTSLSATQVLQNFNATRSRYGI